MGYFSLIAHVSVMSELLPNKHIQWNTGKVTSSISEGGETCYRLRQQWQAGIEGCMSCEYDPVLVGPWTS